MPSENARCRLRTIAAYLLIVVASKEVVEIREFVDTGRSVAGARASITRQVVQDHTKNRCALMQELDREVVVSCRYLHSTRIATHVA